MARLGRIGPLFAFCSVGGERVRRGARGGEARPAGAMAYIPGQPVTAVVQRVEIHKLRQGENLILGFSIGGGIDQDPTQNPFSEDKTDKGIYVTRVTEGGPAEVAGLQVGDKIMQVNGWDMTMVTHDQARKRLTKRNEEVVRLLVTRHSLQKAVRESMMS
ncbi:tax1-binding protein 3 isoform X2 [Podarcis raffonei]|uniref:tax1-binding protein 3 isoform X2 n=1 Tax=Podarcis raffonei TaxID=65483 RepID=UPI002329234A|nr:tax1-binding protein 3 isoform X2 [Podarcis raffonei]